MHVTERSLASAGPTTPADWRLGFRTLRTEIEGPAALPVEGALPAELTGTLYRIGPAAHDVAGERYRHWFDGDGMVHAVTLDPGEGATYRNRFVQTAKKTAEDAAKTRLFGTFGTPPPGGLFARMRGAIPASAANTNVVHHAGRLLALWEAGPPWELDPTTLETVGEQDLDGALHHGRAYSAHPKLDPVTGELWNFGVDYGPRPMLRLYRTDAAGVTRQLCSIVLPSAAMIHDFALTATKAVVVVGPMALPRLPRSLLAGRRSFGESLRWGDGVHIAVVDRASLDVTWHRTDACFFFHVANAYDDGDDAVVDVCAYEDDTVMRLFTEVMVGRSLPVRPRLARLSIGPGGVRRRQLSPTSLEFPRVAPGQSTRAHDAVFGVGMHDEADFLGRPVAVDVATGHVQVAGTRPWQYAGELVPVAKHEPDAAPWLLTLVLDASAGRSELWVLDGAELAKPPTAVVTLPHVVPFGFHGNWVATPPAAR